MANLHLERIFARLTKLDIVTSLGSWISDHASWLSWVLPAVTGIGTYLSIGSVFVALPLALLAFTCIYFVHWAKRWDRQLDVGFQPTMSSEVSGGPTLGTPVLAAAAVLSSGQVPPDAERPNLYEKIAELRAQIEDMSERQATHANTLAEFQDRIIRALRARDALDILRESQVHIDRLFERLTDFSNYLSVDRWTIEYQEWEGHVSGFYRIFMQWDQTVRHPFSLPPYEIANVQNVPDNDILRNNFEAQQRYRTMMVVQRNFVGLYDNAVNWMKNQGQP
jgi:hypothetical protein